MATTNYLYRSIKDKAYLTIRLMYSYDKRNYSFFGKTEFEVTKEYWEGDYKAKRINDKERRDKDEEQKTELEKLSDYVMDELAKIKDQSILTADWLKDVIKEYHHPTPKKPDQPKAPEELIPFFDFYLSIQGHSLSENRKKKLRVTKRKIKRFEEDTNYNLKISDINDNFLNSFLEHGREHKYSKLTLKGDLSILKTICRQASRHDIKISPQLAGLQIEAKPQTSPYLNFDELKAISSIELTGYLDNARNWLIISCYTGQRISDFMRFSSDMIVVNDGKYFLEFKQQKTQKLIIIPFLEQAHDIYKENGNKFPRAISHQKYNVYIKEVCRLAGINEPTTGNIKTCIIEDESKATKNDYRMVRKKVPKHELITSHIGRRSFASNYYGKVPTPYLIMVTGHSSEKQFLNYIQKSDSDKAMESFKYFGQ